jgi:hypothetical protein
MAAIPHDVVTAFVNGKSKSRGAFRSIAGSLYTYDVLIAERDKDGKIRLNPYMRDYPTSATTNIHLAACIGLEDEVTGEHIVKVGPRHYTIK